MGDVGYRGVSADQDGRYRNKEQMLLKKLASNGQFASNFNEKVNMDKVNLEVMKPWISDKVSELLGFEDDVVVEYIQGMLEDVDGTTKTLDPKKMQLSLTGFLEGQTPKFMQELWTLLLSAQKSLGGIPQEFVEKKKEEMRLAREKDQNAIKNSGAFHDHRVRVGPSTDSNQQQQRYERGGDRGRGSRFDDRRPPPRSEFTDKNGNKTERVQDRGWGARAGPVSSPDHARRMDPYHPQGRGIYEARPDYRDRERYSDDRMPYRRNTQKNVSPPRLRGERSSRSVTPEAAYSGKQRRLSPISPRRGRERSLTPDMRGKRRQSTLSRSRSRSYSPIRHRRRGPENLSPLRRRQRSPSYTPSPPRYGKGPSRRSPIRSYSPPRRRYRREITVSRSPPSRSPSASRSPPRRRYKARSRSISRSYSPPSPAR